MRTPLKPKTKPLKPPLEYPSSPLNTILKPHENLPHSHQVKTPLNNQVVISAELGALFLGYAPDPGVDPGIWQPIYRCYVSQLYLRPNQKKEGFPGVRKAGIRPSGTGFRRFPGQGRGLKSCNPKMPMDR